MNPERIISVPELEAGADVVELESRVRDYLQSHPPTLGHGYSHFKKVARFAYQLVLENNYQDPKIAYVCGLLHDLYRPAEGQVGQEDHETVVAKEARKILIKTSFGSQAEEIAATLLNHDGFIQKGKPTSSMEILSIADKADMSFQRAVAYTWASNRCLKEEGKIAYESFMETMRDFCIYQVKAWEIFLIVKIKGVDRAVEAYIRTHEDLIQAVRDELAGKITYKDKSLELAKKEAELEEEFLRQADIGEEAIRKITHNFSELVNWER